MHPFLNHLNSELTAIEADGLLKRERTLTTPQSAHIRIVDKRAQGGERELLNLCANNYLGLADHPEVIGAAHDALDTFGFGMASVRFICGAQTLHRQLEERIARWLEKDDAILFAACFDANGGVFEPLIGPEDAIISDSLNHASIIDGIRLCKARRYRFANSDMGELEGAAEGGRRRGRAFQGDRHRRRLLDGWICREAEGDLRPRRAFRRLRPGRRLPRARPSRRRRPRHTGADWRRRACADRHGHARKDARRCNGRLRCRAAAGHRHASPASAALSLLQFAGARRSRRLR